MRKTLTRHIGTIALCAAFVPTHAAEPDRTVGRVAAADGMLVAQRAEGPRRLIGIGSKVAEGDTLTVGRDGYARIVFDDDAVLVLKPGSRLRLLRYRFAPADAAGDAVEMALLEGAMQSTAGIVATRSPEATAVHTPGGDVHAAGASFLLSLQATPAVAQP